MNAKLSPINELNGIIPSLHTPFKNNKSIDYKSLEKLVLHTIDTNCAGTVSYTHLTLPTSAIV